MAQSPRRRQVLRANQKRGADGKPIVVNYSQEIADEIVARLAEGEMWYRICCTGGLPSYQTFYRWQKQYPRFAADVDEARHMAADYKADRALTVAEESTSATVSADRLHVSTLLWHAGKHAPHLYGCKPDRRFKPYPVEVRIKAFETFIDEAGVTQVREAAIPEHAQ